MDRNYLIAVCGVGGFVADDGNTTEELAEIAARVLAVEEAEEAAFRAALGD